MKINLNGTFKEVIRLVSSPVTIAPGEAKESEFSSLLASIAPNARQTPEVYEQNVVSPRPFEVPKEEMRARLNLGTPELAAPIPQHLSPPEAVPEPIHETDGGVKTPAVVAVKRIKSAEGFNALPHEERVSEVAKLVSRAGMKHGIDPALSIAVVAAESSFDAAAISGDGHSSKGLMQLLDGTGRQLLKHAGLEAQYDPFNPEQNIDLGVGYLRKLHDTFSAATTLASNVKTVPAANSSSLEKLAVAAFNAGEGRVAAAQDRAQREGLNPALYLDVESYLPKSTQEYVSKVMQLKTTFEPDVIG